MLKWVQELTNGSWTLSIWEFLQQLTIKCPWRNASPIIVTNYHKLSTSKLGKRFRHCDVLIQRDAVSSFVPEWECPKDLHFRITWVTVINRWIRLEKIWTSKMKRDRFRFLIDIIIAVVSRHSFTKGVVLLSQPKTTAFNFLFCRLISS